MLSWIPISKMNWWRIMVLWWRSSKSKRTYFVIKNPLWMTIKVSLTIKKRSSHILKRPMVLLWPQIEISESGSLNLKVYKKPLIRKSIVLRTVISFFKLRLINWSQFWMGVSKTLLSLLKIFLTHEISFALDRNKSVFHWF